MYMYGGPREGGLSCMPGTPVQHTYVLLHFYPTGVHCTSLIRTPPPPSSELPLSTGDARMREGRVTPELQSVMSLFTSEDGNTWVDHLRP